MRQGFWNVVKGMVKESDVVLEVLDARMPDITRVKKMEGFAIKSGKPVIFVINKADIVSQKTRNAIKEKYKNHFFILISSKFGRGIAGLISLIKDKSKKEKVKVAVIGYPNTGKSSLINKLSKRGKTITSPESGLTRGKQWISGVKGLLLLDTPGVVPYESRDEVKLGLVSGISPHKIKDPDVVAFELLKLFQKNNPEILEEYYGLNPDMDAYDMLEEIGRKKNMLSKGGAVDERRAAITILEDWHKGKIML